MATILVIDDQSANRTVLVTLLSHQGHRLLEAPDGREGLAAVMAESPDLVITDVLMPVMDGYEFVRHLRLNPATREIPVVFYTAHYGEQEARALALSSGVSYVLTKPADSAEVLGLVGRVLGGDFRMRVLTEPSSPATLATDHVRLLTDKLSEKASDLRTANARLRAMINIGLELGSERDADRLLQSVCVAGHDLFGATYVTLGILDRQNQTLEQLVSWGTDGAPWIEIGDPVSGMLATVVAERRTMRGDNPGGDPAGLHLPWRHPTIQTFLAAPIASPSHVYGWICFVGNEGRSFREDDEDLALALSGQVGRIYENGYLYRIARQERDRAQRYLDTGEVILLALDTQRRITLVNRYACALLGWTADELTGRDWIDTCVPTRLRDALNARFDGLVSGDLSIVENPVLTKSGEERLIEWRNTVLHDDGGQIVGTFSSGTDVTEQRLLEAQYRQAQKMEAIGRLAGGVAHDFNNLLTVILGYCGLLLADLDSSDPRHADLVEVQKAGTSAAALTRQLLAFSRQEIIEPKPIDLQLVIADMRAMLGRLIGDDVTVVLGRQPEPACVIADRGQAEQIVLNLALNARDAMVNGGTLTIETANIELDEDYPKTHLAVTPGPYVMLTVSDTGTGITPEVQARLFEPFFTTKPPGKGTGLGLATVHGIVARSGGSIVVYSELGRGTSFKVYLPRVDAAGLVIERPATVVWPSTGSQTVLVVDDSDGLRELARRLLERHGYTVLVAANADEALRLFEQHPAIDVLLTDVVMPGASGPELIRQLVERRPGLKVLYMSGYTEETIAHHGVLNPGIAFLHKPFTSETLGQKIHEVLNR